MTRTDDIHSPAFCAYWDAARGKEPGRECAWRLKQLWLADKVGNDAEAAEAAQWLLEYHEALDRLGFEIGPVFTKSGRGPFTGIRKKLGAAA